MNTQRAQERETVRFSNIGLRCWWHIQVEMCYRPLKIREGAQERGGVGDESLILRYTKYIH